MSEKHKTNKNDLSPLLGIQPSENNDHNTQLWGMACSTMSALDMYSHYHAGSARPWTAVLPSFDPRQPSKVGQPS